MGGLFFFATLTIYWNSVLHLQNPPPCHPLSLRKNNAWMWTQISWRGWIWVHFSNLAIHLSSSQPEERLLPPRSLIKQERINNRCLRKGKALPVGEGETVPWEEKAKRWQQCAIRAKGATEKKNLKQECVCFVTSARPKKLAGPVVVERFCDGAGWNCEQIAVINTVYWYGRGDRSSIVNGRKGKTLLRLDAFSQ